MPLPPITTITGRAVPFPGDDVDTDRIIPARYMKCITFDGLGPYLFYDVRHHENGTSRNHPIDSPTYHGATILLVGNNFGCGSSREHAPQAIYRAGFRAIIGLGFAEIFFGNSTTLGIPCITIDAPTHTTLTQTIHTQPNTPITIELPTLTLHTPTHTFPFQLRDSAQKSLIQGKWDAIGDLLDGLPQVEQTASTLPYLASS